MTNVTLVKKLDWRSLMSASEDTPSAITSALDEYFSQFVALTLKDVNGKPEIQPQKCVGCDKELTGFFGCWQWGLTHGAGQCSNCGWPSRGHHFVKNAAGEDVITLRNVILQIHPDFVEKRERGAA